MLILLIRMPAWIPGCNYSAVLHEHIEEWVKEGEEKYMISSLRFWLNFFLH